ncbi:secreted protein [gut metagenome]|uniref:Secreted protein n=1 Tax=gut metagenome TaxID=749906 RepID=J9FPG0_9ZZZZ
MIQWRYQSSAAPSVTSPPLMCTTGTLAYAAACAAAKISYRSPSTSAADGLCFTNHRANSPMA